MIAENVSWMHESAKGYKIHDFVTLLNYDSSLKAERQRGPFHYCMDTEKSILPERIYGPFKRVN